MTSHFPGPGNPAVFRFGFDHTHPTLDLSVIVPVWNEIRHIESCLDSIERQELGALTSEILIVDGGSTDGTRELVTARCAASPHLRLIDNPRRKVSYALNAGLRAARGRIVVRMDAHALYSSDYIRASVAALERTGASAVGGTQIPVPGAETPEARAIAEAQQTTLGMGGARHRRAGYEGPADSLPNGVFPRDIVASVGGFDEDLFRTEDNDFFQRIRAAGGHLWLSTTIQARYVCRATLGGLYRQCHATGSEIVPTLLRNPRALSLRHLAPGAAAVLGLATLAAATLGPPELARTARATVVAACGSYALLVLATSLRLAARSGYELLPFLLATFPTLHVSYALGTLVGAVKAPFRVATRRARANSLGCAA